MSIVSDEEDGAATNGGHRLPRSLGELSTFPSFLRPHCVACEGLASCAQRLSLLCIMKARDQLHCHQCHMASLDVNAVHSYSYYVQWMEEKEWAVVLTWRFCFPLIKFREHLIFISEGLQMCSVD